MYLRAIIEEPRFTQDIDSYRRLYSHIDDVHEDLTWVLSRDPRLGEPLAVAPDFRLYTTTAIGDTPAFWVLYTFDAERVYLHSIEPVSG